MIFRDDDVNKLTMIDQFKKVHEIFVKHRVLHTIALIVNGIEEHVELVDYLKKNFVNGTLDIQLHCYDHIKSTNSYEETEKDILLGIEAINSIFEVYPSHYYPTWNFVDDKVIEIASSFGLRTVTEKVTLSKYVQLNGAVMEDVINFHYWAPEVMFLEPALKIYTKTKNK